MVLSKISYCTAEKKSDNICKWVHGVQDQRVLELVEAVGGWTHGQHAISHLAGSLHPKLGLELIHRLSLLLELCVLFSTWSCMAKCFTFLGANLRGCEVKQLPGICQAFLLTFHNVLMLFFPWPYNDLLLMKNLKKKQWSRFTLGLTSGIVRAELTWC